MWSTGQSATRAAIGCWAQRKPCENPIANWSIFYIHFRRMLQELGIMLYVSARGMHDSYDHPLLRQYLGSRTFHWACTFMISCRSTLLNQSTVQETHWLPRRLSRKACEGKKPNSETTTSVMITGTIISSHGSSFLAICGPLNVSAIQLICCLIFLSKMLVFPSVAIVQWLTGTEIT